MNSNLKKLTVNLEGYVIEVAKQKSKVFFNEDINSYINWLICKDNVKEIKKIIRDKEKKINRKKPKMIENTVKLAMYNNICEFCNKEINSGEEICKAEGCKNYIHRNCAIQ